MVSGPQQGAVSGPQQGVVSGPQQGVDHNKAWTTTRGGQWTTTRGGQWTTTRGGQWTTTRRGPQQGVDHNKGWSVDHNKGWTTTRGGQCGTSSGCVHGCARSLTSCKIWAAARLVPILQLGPVRTATGGLRQAARRLPASPSMVLASRASHSRVESCWEQPQFGHQHTLDRYLATSKPGLRIPVYKRYQT